MINKNLDPMTELFVLETYELINDLENQIISVEDEQNLSKYINEMFRIVHTLKASSSMMLFTNLATLAHKAEDLLDIFNRNSDCIPNFDLFIKIILEFIDIFRNKIELVNCESDEISDYSVLINEIDSFIKSTYFFYPTINIKRTKAKQNNKYYISPVSTGESRCKKKRELITIDSSKLDSIIEIINEVEVLDNNFMEYIIKNNLTFNDNNIIKQLNIKIDELRLLTSSLKKVPIINIFTKFDRVIRDVKKQMGKKIKLELLGENISIERSYIKDVEGALIQLIKNSIIHGLENVEEREKLGKNHTGIIMVEAREEIKNTRISVKDDGRGIDKSKVIKKAIEVGLLDRKKVHEVGNEILDFIFMPDFSTETKITEYSGRGYGLNIVKENIERLGGTITVLSEVNKGSEFIIKIPRI